MKIEYITISMWIISSLLISINYPNLGGFMFGILIGGFIIHYLFKFGRYAGDILYDIIFKEE